MRQTTKNFEKISNFQMKFHQTRHHLSKDVRPDMESPGSVDFKTAFIFEFMRYSGVEMGCQRYFMILQSGKWVDIIDHWSIIDHFA